MKTFILFLAMAGSLALTAKPAGAEDSAAPGPGFVASRYETLWTKSPFSVATAEAAQESPDYSLVGIAEFDGVSYASLIERQSQEHFLISSDKPIRGLMLTSITHGPAGTDTYAVVQKDGQPITLKLEQAPAAAATPLNVMNATNGGTAVVIPAPGAMTPQILMPGANLPAPGSTRPLIRFHRPVINLPPRPNQQQEIPSPSQPVQSHIAPPPPK
jgi:hypothetical protein